MDSIFVIQGNEQGTRRVLDRDVVALGRDSSNHVQLRDPEASRRHAEIRRVDERRYVVDLESSNGVFVNGRRVKVCPLSNGDQIQIGKTTLLFASRKIEVGAQEPLVDVFQESDADAASRRVVHSFSASASNAFGEEFGEKSTLEKGADDSDSEADVQSDWLQKARAHLNFMWRATLAASQTLDVDQLLQRFLELIFQWAPVDRGCIFLYDADADKLVPKSSKTRKKNGRVQVSQTILNYAFRNQKCVLTSNVGTDARWNGAESVFHTGVKEAICVPMQGRYGLVGVVYVDVSRSLNDVELGRAENAAAKRAQRAADNANAFGGDRSPAVDAEPRALGAETQPERYRATYDYVSKKAENFDVALLAGDAALDVARTSANAVPSSKRLSFAVYPPFSEEDVPSADAPFLEDGSTWARRSKKLTFDHLKLMVALGRQAALAIEDTQFYLGMAQAERLAAIGQTVAVLSHHIKNILQGIRGGSYLIQTGLKEEDVELVDKGWKIVDKNQTKISDLVLDMLTFSKERTPVWSFADFGETLADVVELMRGRADDLDVELVFRPDDSIPKFYFDREQIHRAVVNLIGNALEASKNYDPSSEPTSDPKSVDAAPRPKYPRARVETTVEYDAPRSRVRVVVDDVGPGVPPEMRDVLFRPFASKNKSGGTGLGLAVTHKIVAEHKGEISVEDSPIGGARFVVELPLVLEKKSELDDAEPFEG